MKHLKFAFHLAALSFSVMAYGQTREIADLLPIDATRTVQGLNCQSPSADNICAVATEACLSAHGTKNCATLDSVEQARRNGSTEKTKALASVSAYFRTLVKEPVLQSICCKNDKACSSRLASTRLEILETGNLNDWLAMAMPRRSDLMDPTTETTVITISASRLLNGNNLETAKALVNHEFGHACEEAWKSSNTKGAYPRFPENAFMRDGCQTDAFNESGIEEILGVTVTQCLRARYKQYAQKNGWSPCIGLMLKEGFADAVFALGNDSVFHWGFKCEARQDSAHPPIRDTLSCLIANPGDRPAVCSRWPFHDVEINK